MQKVAVWRAATPLHRDTFLLDLYDLILFLKSEIWTALLYKVKVELKASARK